MRGTGAAGCDDCAIIIGGCLGMGRDALGRGGMHVLILVFKLREEDRRGWKGDRAREKVGEIDSIVGVGVKREDVGVDGARRMYCLIGF